MLREIGSKDKIPVIKNVKASEGEVRLLGFGHRVYQNYDPRAKVINQMADQVFEVTAATRCSTSPSSWSASPARMSAS